MSRDDAPTPVIYSSMSINDVCQYIDTYVTNGEMASRLIGLIRAGHECRNALMYLCPICPDSLRSSQIIDYYDYFWLGKVNIK